MTIKQELHKIVLIYEGNVYFKALRYRELRKKKADVHALVEAFNDDSNSIQEHVLDCVHRAQKQCYKLDTGLRMIEEDTRERNRRLKEGK